MSYIHCSNGSHYNLAGHLQEAFHELVVEPYENHAPTQPWEKHLTGQDYNYHRFTILGRGGADFNEGFGGLTPDEKTLIYCYKYMELHLSSSYHVFRKHLVPQLDKNRRVVFIDFGCGPLTSGIAFQQAFGAPQNVTCLCVDRAAPMLRKAKAFNNYKGESFFLKGKLLSDWNKVRGYLDEYITPGDRTQIIVNFCYALANCTLRSDSKNPIAQITDDLITIKKKYARHDIYLTYQNPAPDKTFFHQNWTTLKNRLSTFRSQSATAMIEQFSLNSRPDGRVWNSKVRYDILSNKQSASRIPISFFSNHNAEDDIPF